MERNELTVRLVELSSTSASRLPLKPFGELGINGNCEITWVRVGEVGYFILTVFVCLDTGRSKELKYVGRYT